ncbi:MAG: class I SAM-dependent methyltransferase [Chthoniobacterales bacterium]
MQTTLTPQNTINPAALNALVGQMLGDVGAAVNGALVVLGDRLGIYESLAQGPATPRGLAERTGLDERYLREWLSAQTASGYVTYDADSTEFSLTPEQVAVFADPNSPVAMTGGYYGISSVYNDEPKIAEAFRTGKGLSWGDRHTCLFCGVARFFRPGYATHLVSEWIPALDGVEEKLTAGGRVADIGCGHGSSTLIMAAAYPNSTFHGFDVHEGSIEKAREHAAEEGLTNVTFSVAKAKDFRGTGYDLVTTFDALHDMGDPVGAAQHVRKALAPGGKWLIAEPMAGDSLTENLNPVSRIFFGFSTMVCVPTSRSQEVGLALGAQAGQARLSEVLDAGGFRHVRRAAETPFNMILEAA